MPLQVEFKALTSKKWRAARPQQLESSMINLMINVKDEIFEQVTYYPPYNGRYVRTYRLYRGWLARISSVASGIYLTIANDTPYAEHVQGEAQQAQFKRIGWIRLVDATAKVRKDFRKRAQGVVTNFVRGL